MNKRQISEWAKRVSWIGALGALGACGSDSDEPGPSVSSSYALTQAQTCQDVETQVVDVLTEQVLQNRYNNDYVLRGGVPQPDVAAPLAPEAEGGGADEGPTDFSGTNNQEEGVDEADIVKTDGKHIYALNGGDLVVLKSFPTAQTAEIGRITLTQSAQGWGQSLFVHGDKAVVFSGVYYYGDDPGQGGRLEPGAEPDFNKPVLAPDLMGRTFNGTRMSVVDLSDRANPVISESIEIEGQLVDARMIDGQVYAVTNGQLQLAPEIGELSWSDDPSLPARADFDTEEAERERRMARARPLIRSKIDALLDASSLPSAFPRERRLHADGSSRRTAPLYACSDLLLPSQASRLGVLNVTHLDLAGSQATSSTGVLAEGYELYASRENLYVAQSSRSWWWGWGDQTNETHVHKFSLGQGASGRASYVASGRVDGWLLNQFSMSEYQGYLRVATTDNTFEIDEQSGDQIWTGGNHLTVLETQGSTLAEVGAVRDLAPDERIYSARMMGPRGYMVTFRETDPLFTFDLSDPRNPKMLGELKINGYSSYMHPLGANHLLTIGEDGDDQGRITGMHLQVFDVTDMAKPTRTVQLKISDNTQDTSSWSEALHDHRAFTFHNGILAIPIQMSSWSEFNYSSFSGLSLYDVTTSSITHRALINHSDLVIPSGCATTRDGDTPSSEPIDCRGGDHSWQTRMRRSIFIDDYIFSLSEAGFKVNETTGVHKEVARGEL